uniref:DUF4856 domain-containing protein n=1 Tax=Prevotella sp. GTC17254 TaxID=3236794 RepID=A0AB33ITZ0_9BACT
MKKYFLIGFVAALPLLVGSCNDGEGETVESSYFIPPIEEPAYSFSRNGSNNVDVLECEFVKEPIDRIYNSFLKKASIGNDVLLQDVMTIYTDYRDVVKPSQQVATSQIHAADAEKIRKDVLNMIYTSARIGGYKATENNIRTRPAEPGKTGYIGYNLGDVNIQFVDERGLAVAEAFKYMILGSIYIDKILNVHLDERFFESEEMRNKHENKEMPEGKNYTELEHHWDLAYGYYQFVQPLVRGEGLPALRGNEEKIRQAFVYGRIKLGIYDYKQVMEYLHIIRRELSRAIALRAVDYLIGANTLANIKEHVPNAFYFMAQGYGLIYAAQFLRKADGQPYISYAKANKLLNRLLQGKGFWDKDRLLKDVNSEGSLENIAHEIAHIYGFDINEIRK